MNDIWSRGPRARRWLLVFEVVLAGFACLLSIAVVRAEGTSWWGVPATACVFAAFLLRRHSLRWTVALAVAGAVMQLIPAHGFIMFGDLLYGPICAALGSHRERRVRRFGLGCAIVAVIVPGALVLPRWLNDLPHPPALLPLVALCLMFAGVAAVVSVGGWTWGYLRLQQRLQVEASIAARLSEAERLRLEQISEQSAFRERIAAEMHDVVGHSWAVVAAQADGARYAMRTSPDVAETALETIADVARSSITELRDILRQLRYSEGLEGQMSAEQQTALLSRMRDAGMTIDFVETGHPPASQTILLTAYRILTESLTNALKHGDLRRPVTVRLRWADGFTLDVGNAVRSTHPTNDGLGIIGMRERARSLGGDTHITQHDGAWHVRATVPGADPITAKDSR